PGLPMKHPSDRGSCATTDRWTADCDTRPWRHAPADGRVYASAVDQSAQGVSMRSGNPALKESTFLDLGSGSVVSRAGETMTLNGTVNKTGCLLLLTVLTAAFAWNQALGADGLPAPGFAVYMWGGAIGGFILALVTIFKKEWSPVTAPLYALVEGF